ncbi:phosphodiester glycosidase family protein [Streptomyces sp. NPDC098789]|uniref:phosphodiester glycosidase family protein n=1 Tax=Streptomyces sp. NPDC098789 TaxID=3366098 RepID=UPI0038063915
MSAYGLHDNRGARVRTVGALLSAGVLLFPSVFPDRFGPDWVERYALAPGVRLTVVDSPARSLGYRLTEATVGPGSLALLGGRLSRPRPLSSLAEVAGPALLAAVNGDFFDIHGHGVPLGPVIRDGRLLKGSAEPVKAVGTDSGGRLRQGRVQLTGELTLEVSTYPLNCLNCLAPGAGFTVYTPDWGPGPRPSRHGTPVRQLTVSEGRVVDARDGVDGRRIPPDGFVVVAAGPAAGSLAAYGPGAAASFAAAQKPRKRPWTLAIGYRGTLLRHGRVLAFRDTRRYLTREPRTALGWDDTGRRLWLLVVDGRSSRSTGLTIEQTARLLQLHGARNAVMLDGGGSAEMLARTAPRILRIVNVPSEGEERPVANGLALFTAPRRQPRRRGSGGPRAPIRGGPGGPGGPWSG